MKGGKASKPAKASKVSQNDRSNEEAERNAELMDIFRRNFEAQFEVDKSVIRPVKKAKKPEPEPESDEEEFEGFSDESVDEPQVKRVEVIKFVDPSAPTEPISLDSKRAKKSFMSDKAPKAPTVAVESKVPDENEAENLNNDVALQRLINESHILAEASRAGHHSGADISTDFDFNPIGKSRLKALEARLQTAGTRGPAQEKMPMNMRKGLNQSQKMKQDKHEAYAKEAGIVLARKSHGVSKKKPVMRDRGLKIASVGKSTQHGLVISKAEIAKYTTKRRR